MLEKWFFDRLRTEVGRNRTLLVEVLNRLRQTRTVQRPLIERRLADGGPVAAACSARLAVLDAQAAVLAERLGELNASPQMPSAMPYVQFLREGVAGGVGLSPLECWAFMAVGQAETVELLEGLSTSLPNDPRTRSLLLAMLAEERDWFDWLATQLAPAEGTAALAAARERFRDLYARARVHALTSFLGGGLINFGR